MAIPAENCSCALPTRATATLTLSFDDGSTFATPVDITILPVRLVRAEAASQWIAWLGSAPLVTGGAAAGELQQLRQAAFEPSVELLKQHGMSSFSGGLGGPRVLGCVHILVCVCVCVLGVCVCVYKFVCVCVCVCDHGMVHVGAVWYMG